MRWPWEAPHVPERKIWSPAPGENLHPKRIECCGVVWWIRKFPWTCPNCDHEWFAGEYWHTPR